MCKALRLCGETRTKGPVEDPLKAKKDLLPATGQIREIDLTTVLHE